MKTKIFLPLMLLSVLLMSILSISSKAQQYHPFPEENAFWTVAEFNYDIWEYETYIYTVKGDTSLNGNTYKKVYQLNDIPNSNDTLWTLHNFMRQEVDNKKIYFIRHYQGENLEKLGYDFDVEIGDTIILPAFDYANIGDSLFEVIQPVFDSTLLHNGEYRKNYFYKSLYPPYGNFDMSVIEGVGEQRSPFPNLFYFDEFHQSILLCLIVNGDYLYGSSPLPDECDFTVRITDIKHNDKIICKPNPVDKFLSIILQHYGTEKFELQVINNTGMTIIQQSIRIRKSEYLLDVSVLPVGIYCVILKNNERYHASKIIVNH